MTVLDSVKSRYKRRFFVHKKDMAFLTNPKALLMLLLLLNVCTTRCEYQTRQSTLTISTGSECVTDQIGPAWTSPNQFECSLECLSRYPGTCQSTIFNNQTKLCTPGSVAFTPRWFIKGTIPSANSADTISFAMQPIPSCSEPEYVIYEQCGLSLCLHKSPAKAKFPDARIACANMNGRIFVANTKARFAMFWAVSGVEFKDNTWVGLTDEEEEGKFVWENGVPLSAEQSSYIWQTGEPNNFQGREKCGVLRHDKDGYGDEWCGYPKKFMCERIY